jgi:hypothetical protein
LLFRVSSLIPYVFFKRYVSLHFDILVFIFLIYWSLFFWDFLFGSQPFVYGIMSKSWEIREKIVRKFKERESSRVARLRPPTTLILVSIKSTLREELNGGDFHL